MPTLEWIGKNKAVNHHLDVPYHVLDRKYSFDESGQHEENNGNENMIIHGDNLLALKASCRSTKAGSSASTSIHCATWESFSIWSETYEHFIG